MPLDPIVSLSVALAEAPGACAVLLGAGVSKDAGVPTAWEIRQDGMRRLYRLETCSEDTPRDDDLDEWLREHGHDGLGYSSLLNLIAPDPAIRRQLLAGYFEGVEPGPAHERLADLAATGVLRVFLTTNFDRLIERALIARGIDPVVVSDDATLRAAPRREHAPVFIVKAHGDYMQETIRNTESELAELEPAMTAELKAIVDHYGLLVIGWSGGDRALAEILRKRSPSRYGAWWLSRTDPPNEPARTLIETTGARLIVRPGAGDFLGDLSRRVAVYRAHQSGDDPGSVHDQILGLVKRGDEVDLDEVLRRERYAFESVIEAVRSECANVTLENDDAMMRCWERLAAAIDRRIGSLMPVALYRPEMFATAIEQHAAWATGLPPAGGTMMFVDAWQTPFWVLGMTLGGLAVRLDRYEALRPLLTATWSDPNGHRVAFVMPNELAEWVGRRFGSSQQALFRASGWLASDLREKEWLVSRYPEWLRRQGEPEWSLAEFSLLLNLATTLGDVRGMTAWWSANIRAAERYARRLRDDASLRAKAANAVGTTLETFDERAPEILRAAPAIGAFPDSDRVANILRTGNQRT
jgi:hypothetical protein